MEKKEENQIDRKLKARRRQIEFLKKTFGVEEHTKEEAEEFYCLACYVMGLFDEN